jgi:hypothetical protein
MCFWGKKTCRDAKGMQYNTHREEHMKNDIQPDSTVGETSFNLGPVRKPVGAVGLLGLPPPSCVGAGAEQSASNARSVVAARRAARSALLLPAGSPALENLQKKEPYQLRDALVDIGKLPLTMPADRTRAGQLEQPRVNASLVEDVLALARQHADVIAVLKIDYANRARFAADR